MYRVNDRVSAIKEIQGYLGAIIGDEPFVAPSGVYELIIHYSFVFSVGVV